MAIDVRLQELWHKDAIGLWILDRDFEGGKTKLVKPVVLTWEDRPECFMLPEPTLELRREKMRELLKALLDACAESSFIDSKAERREAEVQAIKAHLGDVQKTVDRLFRLIERKADSEG